MKIENGTLFGAVFALFNEKHTPHNATVRKTESTKLNKKISLKKGTVRSSEKFGKNTVAFEFALFYFFGNLYEIFSKRIQLDSYSGIGVD